MLHYFNVFVMITHIMVDLFSAEVLGINSLGIEHESTWSRIKYSAVQTSLIDSLVSLKICREN